MNFGHIVRYNDISRWDRASKEDLATIGLQFNQWNDITENMIRAEHGIWRRCAY